MALINCPECGKEVSDKAAACPFCGYPLSDVVEPKLEQLKNSKVSNEDTRTKIIIWGPGNSGGISDLVGCKQYLYVDGVRIQQIPLNGKTEYYIDKDCTLSIEYKGLKFKGISGDSIVSYPVKYGQPESLVIKFDKVWGGIVVNGTHGKSVDKAKQDSTKRIVGGVCFVYILIFGFIFFCLFRMCS